MSTDITPSVPAQSPPIETVSLGWLGLKTAAIGASGALVGFFAFGFRNEFPSSSMAASGLGLCGDLLLIWGVALCVVGLAVALFSTAMNEGGDSDVPGAGHSS